LREGVVNLACELMTTTKKKVVNFCDEKSAPPEKILATPMPDRNMRRQK